MCTINTLFVKMPVTRDVKEQIENSVNQAIIKSLQNEDFIKTITKTVVTAVIKTLETRLIELEESVAYIKNEIDIMKNDSANKIIHLEENDEEQKSNDVIKRIDQIDQTNRLTNLRLFNMEEKHNEDTKNEVLNLIKGKLGINVKPEDIDFCYRIGAEGSKERRGILIKLGNMTLKQSIYGKKNILKGTGIVIKEDLTKSRLELVNKLSEKLGLKNVWTLNGKIFVFYNKKVHLIKTLDDLIKLETKTIIN